MRFHRRPAVCKDIPLLSGEKLTDQIDVGLRASVVRVRPQPTGPNNLFAAWKVEEPRCCRPLSPLLLGLGKANSSFPDALAPESAETGACRAVVSALDEESAPVKTLTVRISMLVFIVRRHCACFGSFASYLYAEVSAPVSTPTIIVSILMVAVHGR